MYYFRLSSVTEKQVTEVQTQKKFLINLSEWTSGV